MNEYLTTGIKSKCCGCGGCEKSCPQQCISMKINDEGFAYPTCNTSQCIECDICTDVCPMEQIKVNRSFDEPLTYVAHILDDKVLKKSSSGGIFPCMAKFILKNHGVVVGAALNKDRKLKHQCITSINELPKIQGSKYIQSNTNYVFCDVEKYLKDGRTVLFVGTPCQVSGLLLYLGYDYPNLYTIDFVCHGVPSQLMFEKYVDYLEHKHRGTLTEIYFRDKEKNGWSITLKYVIRKKNGKDYSYYLERHFSEYFSGFLRGLILRESCYVCPYTSLERSADVTLADFWGIEKVLPELDRSKGQSLVLLNNEKGKRLFENIKQYIWYQSVTIKQATIQNINFYKPTFRPKERDFIYTKMLEKGFKYVGKKYMRPPHYLKLLISSKIPVSLKNKLKKGYCHE